MVGDDFTPSQIVASENLIDSKQLHPRYQYLPIDTRYLKDLKLRILGHLDDAVDGWLIKSENYQALNSILPKWQGKVQCIYIDPLYNTGYDEFVYADRFRYATWLTMMTDRLRLAHQVLSSERVIAVSIDENQVSTLGLVMNDIFGSDCYKNEVVVRRGVKNVRAQFDTVDALNKGDEITQQTIDDWVAKQSAISGEKVDLLRLSRRGQPEH